MGLCLSKTPSPPPSPPSMPTSKTPPSLPTSKTPPSLPSSKTPFSPPPAPHTPSLPSWPDLPSDLAGLVLCRLDSHEDRLSFGAACRDWRLAVRRQHTLRGATPWLNLGLGVYQSLLDGQVHRFFCHGSSGCWVLYYHDPAKDTPGGRCLFLRNPLHPSSASIEILWPCREASKIVLCSSLYTAAILHRGVCIVAPYWPADLIRPPEHRPWLPLFGCDYVDMAYFREQIFTLTRSGDLVSHDVFDRSREDVIKSSVACDRPADDNVCHLLVSADKEKLLMVRWSIRLGVDDRHGAMDLKVSEADLAKGQWSEVKNLGGQTLFLSRSCCRAFGAMELDQPAGTLQGNRVYILGIDWYLKRAIAGAGPCNCRDCRDHADNGIPSYCTYDMMTGILSLVSLGGGHVMESALSEWFFPCE